MNLGTASVTDLAWLAGVIDSEGTVSLVKGAHGNPVLRVSIYNSSHLILDKVARTLYALEIKWSEHADRRHERTGYGMHMSTAAAMALYPHVREHMVRQVGRYDAGYYFMQPRLERSRRARWTDRDREIWANLREVFNAR